ncbi:MAG: hypothetical protein IJN58_08415, partial [Clostridia bacterium]|nr:hypothetical protein [Clostridia bacterium]
MIAIVAPLADEKRVADKYSSHLQELFDAVEPTAIGRDYELALQNKDCAAMVRTLAAYYRSKPD